MSVITNFRNKGKDFIANTFKSVKGQGTSKLSTLMQSLNSLKEKVVRQVDVNQTLSDALGSCQDVFDDEALYSSPSQLKENATSGVLEVSNESAMIIKNALYSSSIDLDVNVSNNVIECGDRAITLSDSIGQVANMVVNFEPKTVTLDEEVGPILLHCATDYADNVFDMKQVVMYEKSGKLFINRNIIGEGFNYNVVKQHIIDAVQGTVTSRLRFICSAIEASPTGNDLISVLSSIWSKMGWNIPQPTILNYINSANVHLSKSDDTLDDMVQSLLTTLPFRSSLREGVLDLWSIISNCVKSTSIYRVWVDIANACASAAQTLDAALSGIVALCDGAKYLLNTVKYAYGIGGITAAIQALIDYLKGATTIQNDGNILIFTDRDFGQTSDSVAPALTAIFSTVSQLANIIVALWNTAIGFAMSILSGLLNQVLSGIQYSINDLTRCTVDELAQLPILPTPIWATESSISEFNPLVIEALYDGVCLTAEIPGAYVVIGFNPDRTAIRTEYHLSIRFKYDMNVAVEDKLYIQDYFRASRVEGQVTSKLFAEHPAIIVSLWAKEIERWPQFRAVLDNTSDDNYSKHLLAANEDYEARVSAEVSLSYFLWYVFSCWSTYSGAYLGSTKFSSLSPFIDLSGRAQDFPAVAPGVVGSMLYNLLNNGAVSEWAVITQVMASNVPYYLLAYGSIGETHNFYYQLGYGDRINLVYHYLNDQQQASILGGAYPSLGWCVIKAFGSERLWLGELNQLINSRFYLMTPSFSRAALIAALIITNVAAAIGTAVAIYASVKTKKAKRRRAAQNAANAEQAWANFVKTGSETDYAKYQKAVTKNNLASFITGGSTVSRNGFWATDDSGESTDTQIGGYSIKDLYEGDDPVQETLNATPSYEARVASSVDLQQQNFERLYVLLTGFLPN